MGLDGAVSNLISNYLTSPVLHFSNHFIYMNY